MSGVGKDPVELLTRALKIYSPTDRESKLAAFLSKEMKAMGYSDVRIDDGGNVVGEIGKGRHSLLLCGHMDTVPGKLPVRLADGVLSGRGAADAKSPLCALLVAGAKAAGSGLRITFAGVTREESDGLGVQTLIKSGRKHQYAVFGEPSGSNRLTIGYRGRVEMHITLRTEGGHAGSPWAHRNALDEFYSVLALLRKLERERTVQGDHFHSVSISPTLLKAGTYHNVIPDTCEATFDVRVPPGLACDRLENEIRSLVTANTGGSSNVTLDFDEATEAYETDPNSTVVRAFQRAVLLRTDSRPVMVRKTGTGDMNTMAAATGTQCVTYGPGDSSLSHTSAECVRVDDYLRSIEVIAEAIRQIATLTGTRA